MSKEEYLEDPTYKILCVVTKDGQILNYKENPGAALVEGVVTGISLNDEVQRTPLSEIQSVYVERFDLAVTFAVLILVPAAIVGIIIATKESCPFIYSFNGDKFIFDGEPYGGAICEGLKRTDYCRLEHIKAVNNEYKFIMTNEVDETQHTDEFKLLIADHLKGTEIIPDENGKFYTINEKQKPYSITDKKGNERTKWLAENDMLVWENDPALLNPDNPADLRDTFYMSFPKPRNAREVKFIANAGTTLWGSQMLKKISELQGNKVNEWYGTFKNPSAKNMLNMWNNREEVYHLKINVLENNKWITRGMLIGGGPFTIEDRVVPLNIENVNEDTLKIMITPASGFWRLNYFAVDYSKQVPFELCEVSAKYAQGSSGEDILSTISATDGIYYSAPETGDKATITFQAPEKKEGTERTVFAKVSGYYDIHMNKERKPDYELAQRVNIEQGFITKYAIREYQKWYENATAKLNK